MYYVAELEDYIRVAPNILTDNIKEVIKNVLKDKFSGYISEDLGIVIDVLDVIDLGQGIVVPEDGGVYYATKFKVLTFKPLLHEVVYGFVREITDFGLFLSIGPIDGMVHISQTMDDFVSFSKDKVLQGKETKKTLRVGDLCRARIIAISYKDITNPRIGLVMRQKGLGRLEWIKEELYEKKKTDQKTKQGNKSKK